ncbi:unnamed protein product [Cladocopium goreaui]|uniref:Reverse transcriptase domain-containing protein n=1 Tax=Cladocopium goreaui TaxID=2562237 RepID=A0A9P1DGZ9_9DINO|nr:unnamed protein product [Cladocopium goreaui]
MSLSRSTSHGSSSCSSVIKALRWLLKSAEVGCLQVVHSVLIGTFLNQKVPRDRKQAPPLPLWALVQWERRVLMSNCTVLEIILLGTFLLMAWGSLRFSDAQRLDLQKIIYHDGTMRGVIWRSKTAVSGMPLAVAAEGFLSKGSHNWLWKFLTVLDTVLAKSGLSDVDFLLPLMDEDGPVYPLQPMDYATALFYLRKFLGCPWSQRPDPLQHLKLNFTLHSLKATLLSWGPQLHEKVTPEQRLSQGHHSDPNSSLDTYSRDVVWTSLTYQRKMIQEVQGGWRPAIAQHRGRMVIFYSFVGIPKGLPPHGISAMKQKFMANYPSELIHADLFPSTRLVSLVHDQLSKKVWKWVPWKYRISLTRSEEISSNRAQKMPKIDHLGLHSLLFDDPPSIDVSNNAMGVNSIRNMLEVHDRAIALCQGAHLANLKAYTHKFIGFLTAKYDGDLRNPSVLEAQHADQKIWTVIAELMERGKGQGKSKGKQNSGKSKGKVQWLTEIQRDGGFKQLCMRYQVDSVETDPVHDVDPVQDFAPPIDSFTPGRLPQPEQVGYGAASPSCCEYSRLKLRDDDGPKALRSPEHLSGLPNLTPWELQRVQESFLMLSRCVEVLTLVFQAGLRDDSGAFASRATAQYPQKLAQLFANLVAPLLDTSALDLQWSSLDALMPTKHLSDYPFAQIDGGGAFSHPDWSQDNRQEHDWFQTLRTSWMNRIISERLDKILLAHVASGNPSPPFSMEILTPFKDDLEKFLEAHGHPPDWSVRPHQPIHLHILHSLQKIMHDVDFTLLPSLLEGVRTGFSTAIPPSGIFPPKERADIEPDPLSAHLSNWQSAEEDLPLTRELVQEEIDKGWVFAYKGSLEEAQQEYPAGVSIGKLGVTRSDSRAPRLVVDSSVCGLNGRCIIPERSTLPTAKEVLRSYPLRQCQRNLMGFSLDVKAAHKRIVLHPDECGLVGFSLERQLFFYRVTPFGAVFSAFWWARLGGLLLRIFHHLIWLNHAGFLYVDDFLFFMEANMMPLSATLLCIFCHLLEIPISWKKTAMHSSIDYIGWKFNFNAGIVTIPIEKILKLRGYIEHLVSQPRTTRKSLEKLIGLAMWITQLFPLMRIWIHYWYHDLYTIPATHFSIDAGTWPRIHQYLTPTLTFHTAPLGSAIPISGKLIAVRHQAVSSLADLTSLHIKTENRIWLRIINPNSSKRKLRPDSLRILKLFDHWLMGVSPSRPMRAKPYWNGIAAADACASGSYCQIGGFIRHHSGVQFWFSEKFSHADFDILSIHLDPNMQRSIASFETLAQIALVWLVATSFPGFRIPICVKSLSDNTGAESVSNKLFTTTHPLCLFVEILTCLASTTGIELDVSHIPGADNVIADDLSRWDFSTPIPHDFQASERIHLSLNQLFRCSPHPTLHPPDSKLLWKLPHPLAM